MRRQPPRGRRAEDGILRRGRGLAAGVLLAAGLLLAAGILSVSWLPEGLVGLWGSARAEADRTLILTADGSPEAVRSRLRGSVQTLFAPGVWDLRAVSLEMPGQEVLLLGEERTEVRPGEAADLTAFLNRKTLIRDGQGRSIATMVIRRGSPLPALFLTVDPERLSAVRRSQEEKIDAGQLTVREADGSLGYRGSISLFRGRGNSTFAYQKKPFELKVPEKIGPAGLPGGKTWVLLANYTDLSLLRNQLALDTAREIGLPCAVRCAQADLWINGDYQGLYLLTEKVQIKKNRVSIRDLEEENEALLSADPASYPRFKKAWGNLAEIRGYELPADPEDVTGGYIAKIEKDHRYGNTAKPGFQTQGRLCVRIIEPTCPSLREVQYLAERVDEAMGALLAKDGIHPETGKGWQEYLDAESFALKFLLEEWCKNFDFLGGSQYFYKDSDAVDPLIYAGPAWDYDLAFGNMTSRGFEPRGNYMTTQSRRPGNLYWVLYGQEAFRRETGLLWRQRFRPAMAILLGETADGGGRALKSLAEYAEEIRDSAGMNFERWGAATEAAAAAGTNFDSALRYLEKWIRIRVDFMDGENGGGENTEEIQSP